MLWQVNVYHVHIASITLEDLSRESPSCGGLQSTAQTTVLSASAQPISSASRYSASQYIPRLNATVFNRPPVSIEHRQKGLTEDVRLTPATRHMVGVRKLLLRAVYSLGTQLLAVQVAMSSMSPGERQS